MNNYMLTDIKGVGAKVAEKLYALGILEIEDLVNLLPVSYLDLTKVTPLADAEDGAFVFIEAEVSAVSRPVRVRGMMIFKLKVLTTDGASISINFYNHKFAHVQLVLGGIYRFYGKLKKTKTGAVLNNPLFSTPEAGTLSGIRTIYPKRVKQAFLRGVIANALPKASFVSVVGEAGEAEAGLIPLGEGYRLAHFPTTLAEAERGRKRILMEETVRAICAYKLERKLAPNRVRTYSARAEVVGEVKLPFALTPSQALAVNKLIARLNSEKYLNSMLIGDVGSGKTVVTLLSAYYVVRSGRQVAVICPTEILAGQHFASFSRLLSGHNVRCVLLTGGLSAQERRATLTAIAEGTAHIVIGTHAVIGKSVVFSDLALAVIDEQHRFGVAQRTALLDKGKEIDTLTLSATPIPRSLLLSLYGEVDVLTIEKRSHGNIKTRIVQKSKLDDMLNFIAGRCSSGTEATYIVCPEIYDEDGESETAVESLSEYFIRRAGNRVRVATLHGGMKNKDKVLSEFANGNIDVLISTTVVEVGIDVARASIIVVMSADRFGLATLHQLRGRVGRAGQEAYCFLCTAKTEEEDLRRLTVMVATDDGHQIAEEDFAMRGAGDWLSKNQSGKNPVTLTLPEVRLARKLADGVDTEAHFDLLRRYVKRLDLKDVSFN